MLMNAADKTDGVRPTKRCLDDLGIPFPKVNTPLHEIDHALINKAQHLPAEAEAGGAERIKSLTDRVWLKCKVTNLRGAVTQLDPSDTTETELLNSANAWWWLGAAGERKEDSASDFYKSIEAEATRLASGSHQRHVVSTAHLLPQAVDYTRLRAEQALQVALALKRVVRTLIYRSITDGKVWEASITGHAIKVCVRAKDEEAYIAIAADGFLDANIIAVILNAVPKLQQDDWQAEPGGVMGITPGYGQIVYSAVIPPTVQAVIIEQFDGEEAE